MKKYLYLMISGVIAISCAKEIEPTVSTPEASGERQEITFNAGNSQTKTTLSEGTAVLWASQDALTVFDAELTNNRFSQSSLSEDFATASFTGEAAVSDTYYAVYPYRAGNASASAGVISTYLSPDQFAVANSFGPGANLSMGVSKTVNGTNSFVMQQVGAFIKFSFSGCNNVTSICLKAIGGEKISGGVTATYAEGVFNAVTNNDGSALDEVTLYPAAGSEYIAEGTYYVVVLPVTLNSGLQIIFTEKTDGVEKVISAKVDSPIELTRNTVSALPSAINLPDVSNPAWMAQETVSVLFRAPAQLMEVDGESIWPFDEDKSTYVKQNNTVTDFTLTDSKHKIGMHFMAKSLSHNDYGCGAYSGSCTNWGFRIPAIEGKRIAKVEYYTSAANYTGDPRLVTSIGGKILADGGANTAKAGYSKYVWNISSLESNTGCFINYSADGTNSVFTTGFRIIYRDAEGPAKSVISTSTDIFGPTLDQDVALKGSFVSYDGTADGYTYGFEYKTANAAVMSRASASESFSGSDSYSLRSTQNGEWTNVDGEIEGGTSFVANLSTLARGESYLVRAWARVGTTGEKVYGNEQTITLLAAVHGDKTWKYGDGEFFTVWKNISLEDQNEYDYDWENRVELGEYSYKYGADGLLYEVASGTTGIDFKDKSYLKFGSGQKFSFIAAESGTANIAMSCKSTSSSERTITVSVNGESAVTFKSPDNTATATVNSQDFFVNEGDKITITVNNNINLYSIAYTCAAQGATYDVEVDADSRSDRDNVYTFSVNASDDVVWTAEVTAGAGEGVVLSKTSGTGDDEFTLTVPVNMDYTRNNNYVVTVSTEDERILEENRVRTFNLTQGHLTKVLFGCVWSKSFMKGWESAGWTTEIDYTAQLATVRCTSTPNFTATDEKYYTKGNTTFKFVAGETGTGTLKFRAAVGNNKYLKVSVAGDVKYNYKNSTGSTETIDYEDSFSVAEGDEVMIQLTSGSSNHKLYIGGITISWTGTPAN